MTNQAAHSEEPRIESLSAITLATHDMARAVPFYEALGFPLKFGGPPTSFFAEPFQKSLFFLQGFPNISLVVLWDFKSLQ